MALCEVNEVTGYMVAVIFSYIRPQLEAALNYTDFIEMKSQMGVAS